jgi:hypothetical protein
MWCIIEHPPSEFGVVDLPERDGAKDVTGVKVLGFGTLTPQSSESDVVSKVDCGSGWAVLCTLGGTTEYIKSDVCNTEDKEELSPTLHRTLFYLAIIYVHLLIVNTLLHLICIFIFCNRHCHFALIMPPVCQPFSYSLLHGHAFHLCLGPHLHLLLCFCGGSVAFLRCTNLFATTILLFPLLTLTLDPNYSHCHSIRSQKISNNKNNTIRCTHHRHHLVAVAFPFL